MEKGRGITRVLIGILAVFLVLVTAVGLSYQEEIKTINSIQKVDDYGFYQMDYYSDYYFDDFLKVGASTNQALIKFITGKMLKGYPMEIAETDLACTTFNAKTPKGDYIFGRNFDMSYSPGMLVHTRPENGYESLSMVNLAFLGYKDDYMPDEFFDSFVAMGAPYAPLDGINEKGLSIGILLIPDNPTKQETEKVDITCTAAIRLLLDKAASVDEALELLKKYDMHDVAGVCYHYQIADANGKSAVVEYVNNQMQVIRPTNDYQVCTNFYLSPGEKFNFGDGQNRYSIAMRILRANKGIVDEKEGMGILDAAKIVDAYDKQAGIMYNTQWSAIYNNTRKSLDICVGQDYQQLHHFNFDD